MLIKKIILHNFRQFIGTQEIEFSTDKNRNVTVLIGDNTAGKTTLVRAFEWILYCKNEFDDKNLLNKNVVENMQVGDVAEIFGTLIIEHLGTEYEISRKQRYTCIAPKVVKSMESVPSITYMQPDGQTKTPRSEFDSNIERILPRKLSSYFFFGGERVASISTREDIESSVKGLMGLDVLDNARTHLQAVTKKFQKSMDYSGNQDAQSLQRKLDEATLQKQKCIDDLSVVNDELDYYRGEKEKYAVLLKTTKETSKKQKRREALERTIAYKKDELARRKRELVSAFSKNAFAFFSMPMLKKAMEQLMEASEDTESVPNMDAVAIEYLLHRGTCLCGTCLSPGSLAEKMLLAEKKKLPPESIGTSVRKYKERAKGYINSSEDYFEEIKRRYMDIRSCKRELEDCEDELSELSESLKGVSDVSDYNINYNKAVQKIAELEQKVRKLNEDIGAWGRHIQDLNTKLAAYNQVNEKNSRISNYIGYTTAVFEWIDTAYCEREGSVRKKLEEKVNANFSEMYHGSRTVTIDEKYRVKYVDVTTEESDGLKAVKSFAFVSGLVDLAKEILTSEDGNAIDMGPQYYPLVMDAPFSNLDETHIQNISRILTSSAEQVIIAVMKKDWEPAAQIMEPIVGKAYTIAKDCDVEGKEIDTMSHITVRS